MNGPVDFTLGEQLEVEALDQSALDALHGAQLRVPPEGHKMSQIIRQPHPWLMLLILCCACGNQADGDRAAADPGPGRDGSDNKKAGAGDSKATAPETLEKLGDTLAKALSGEVPQGPESLFLTDELLNELVACDGTGGFREEIISRRSASRTRNNEGREQCTYRWQGMEKWKAQHYDPGERIDASCTLKKRVVVGKIEYRFFQRCVDGGREHGGEMSPWYKVLGVDGRWYVAEL